MRARRLIFVQAPRGVGLTPVFVALLALIALSLVSILAVIWPRDRAPSGYRPAAGDSMPASRPYEGGLHVPLPERERPGRTRGI